MKNKIIIIIAILGVLGYFGAYATNTSFTSNNETYQLLNNNTISTYSANSSSTNQRYALNSRTGKQALLTEKLIVKLKNNNAQHVANIYNLNLEKYFSHLRVAVFSTNGQDIFHINNLLNQDNNIEKSSIEVIENFAQPL